jgi:hypothetical protein
MAQDRQTVHAVRKSGTGGPAATFFVRSNPFSYPRWTDRRRHGKLTALDVRIPTMATG